MSNFDWNKYDIELKNLINDDEKVELEDGNYNATFKSITIETSKTGTYRIIKINMSIENDGRVEVGFFIPLDGKIPVQTKQAGFAVKNVKTFLQKLSGLTIETRSLFDDNVKIIDNIVESSNNKVFNLNQETTMSGTKLYKNYKII